MRTAAFDSMLDRLADSVAEAVAAKVRDRLESLVGGGGLSGGAGRRAKGARRGVSKLDMSCRVTGCKNRSRGPRCGFICDKHRSSLSKAQQKAARDEWNVAKKKAA